MEKRVNEILKKEELYFTNEEVIQMMKEFKKTPMFNLIHFHPENSWKPKLDELGIDIKEFVKYFYDSTFDLDYDLYKDFSQDEVTISNAFDLNLIQSKETSHINEKNYYIDDEKKRFCTSFGNIYINENNDIMSCVEYVHELAHALVERHNKEELSINSELIAILLELYFAYDVETDKKNYIPITSNFFVNKFNPGSVMIIDRDEEKFNYSLTKELINNRLCEILCMCNQFQMETDINTLINFSSYINSTINAINIFDLYVDGGIGVLGYLEDVLSGKINTEEFIESCSQEKKLIK